MSASERERLARVALNRLGEPGDLRLTSLTLELGAERLLELLGTDRSLGGLGVDVASRRRTDDATPPVTPEETLERAERIGMRFVVPGDAEWPASLQDLTWSETLHERGGPPVGLWVRGPVRLDALAAGVAVVGSRSATTYGTQVASDLAGAAARAGLPVVSGAAFGIDQAAHRGALVADGPTVAVLACGADRVYPQAHADLIGHLAVHGAVVSEAAPGTAPLRIRFLARNRLIAALTRATVVVEAAHRSGALNTASWATRLHRLVLGVPGPVTSAASQGVHRLLRSGAAELVTSGEDLLEALGPAGEHLAEEVREPPTARDRLSSRERQVLDAVPVSRAAGTDSVARTAGLGVLEVRSALARIAQAGLVEQADGGWRLAPGA